MGPWDLWCERVLVCVCACVLFGACVCVVSAGVLCFRLVFLSFVDGLSVVFLSALVLGCLSVCCSFLSCLSYIIVFPLLTHQTPRGFIEAT